MSSKSYSLDGHFFEVRVMQLCTILICYSPEDRQAHEHTHTHTHRLLKDSAKRQSDGYAKSLGRLQISFPCNCYNAMWQGRHLVMLPAVPWLFLLTCVTSLRSFKSYFQLWKLRLNDAQSMPSRACCFWSVNGAVNDVVVDTDKTRESKFGIPMPGCQVCEANAVDCEDGEFGIHSGSAKSVTEDAPAWTPATKGGEEELLHFRMLQAIFEPESGLYKAKFNQSLWIDPCNLCGGQKKMDVKKRVEI